MADFQEMPAPDHERQKSLMLNLCRLNLSVALRLLLLPILQARLQLREPVNVKLDAHQSVSRVWAASVVRDGVSVLAAASLLLAMRCSTPAQVVPLQAAPCWQGWGIASPAACLCR